MWVLIILSGNSWVCEYSLEILILVSWGLIFLPETLFCLVGPRKLIVSVRLVLSGFV